jgi:hypothetical protein
MAMLVAPDGSVADAVKASLTSFEPIQTTWTAPSGAPSGKSTR